MAQNATDIESYIRSKFGAPVVDCELDATQIAHSINEAARWLCAYQGQTKFYLTPSGNNTLTVPDDCDTVVDVIFEDQGIATFFDWAGIEVNAYDSFFGNGFAGGYSNSYSVFSDYIMVMQRWEMGRNVLGLDADWEYLPYDRMVRLYPSGRNTGTQVLVVYNVKPENLSYEKLQGRFYMILRDYAYACAMEILGHIRTKYSEMPSATGTITMNGDTLLGNAEVLRMALYEQITKLRDVTGFMVK